MAAPPRVGSMSRQREIAAALAVLQRQAERLTVSHRNPEKFHEDKSELVAGLARLRHQLEAP
jgi:hypothetical protein